MRITVGSGSKVRLVGHGIQVAEEYPLLAGITVSPVAPVEDLRPRSWSDADDWCTLRDSHVYFGPHERLTSFLNAIGGLRPRTRSRVGRGSVPSERWDLPRGRGWTRRRRHPEVSSTPHPRAGRVRLAPQRRASKLRAAKRVAICRAAAVLRVRIAGLPSRPRDPHSH